MRGVVNDTHKSFFYAKSLLQIETFAAVLDEAKMHHTSFEMQLIRNSIVCINLWKNLKFCFVFTTKVCLQAVGNYNHNWLKLKLLGISHHYGHLLRCSECLNGAMSSNDKSVIIFPFGIQFELNIFLQFRHGIGIVAKFDKQHMKESLIKIANFMCYSTICS